MNFRVLVSAPPILPHVDDYNEICSKKGVELIKPDFKVIESLNHTELEKLLVNVDGILCGDDDLNATVLKNANKLKVISKWGTGIDSIDSNAAHDLGIKVLRVKDVFAPPLSETVLAYILMISRKILEKDKVVRANNWSKITSFTLQERTLGIVGLGHVGMELARKASAFGMKVNFVDIRDISCDLPNVEEVGKKKLLKESDFISIHCDLNDTSKHLFGKEEFKMMKKEAVIINTARGPIIKESDLVQALANEEIGGAALDVFEQEPLAEDSPLRNFSNVYLSPHNSNASPLVFKEVDLKAIENIFLGFGLT